MHLPAICVRSRKVRGAALLETWGALCVLAIVLMMLTPAVLRAIEVAQLASTVQSLHNLKEAVDAYYQKHGKIAGRGGAALSGWYRAACENWDRTVLLAEGLIESPLRTPLATNASVRVVRVTTTSSNTAILSFGNVGSLGGFNGNNGLYNFTQEYAAASLPTGTVPRLAGGSWGPALAWAVLSRHPMGRWLVRHLVSPAPAPYWAAWQAEGQSGDTGQRLWVGFRHAPDWAGSWNPGGRGFEVCYPLPAGTPSPGGDIGYNISVPNPMFPDPKAKTHVVATSSAVPAYVVEVILQGVSVENAYRLSRAIDGVRQSNWAYFDSLGRVKYDMYDAYGGTRTGVVFIYLAHK